MQDADLIQRAHDLLDPISTGEIPLPDGLNIAEVNAITRTLCWVLKDGNEQMFQGYIELVETKMREMGYELGVRLPFPMKRTPGQG